MIDISYICFASEPITTQSIYNKNRTFLFSFDEHKKWKKNIVKFKTNTVLSRGGGVNYKNSQLPP